MNHYNCPYCEAYLNANGFVALLVRKDHGVSGIVLLSEELGNYASYMNAKIESKEGEKSDFNCPSCSKSLIYGNEDKLVRLFKTDAIGEKHTILFSAIKGEQSTYQISEERQLTFGEHALKFIDPEWYLKE